MNAVATTTTGSPAAATAPPATRTLLREQGLVAAGQLTAGVGNLVFALLSARLLAPGPFAELAVFLALFLVVHVPLGSLSAGSAVTPAFAARHRRRTAALGLGAGAVLALAAVPLAPVLEVPAALLLVLAAGAPSAGWLALERGRLIGAGDHRRAVASLVAEPVLRIGAGLPLAAAFGAVGGAAGVVAGGWLALLVTRPGLPRRRPLGARAEGEGTATPAAAGAGTAGLATLAFLLLAMLQNADVVLANTLLGELDAGRFAVLSTLGGAAAFATTTIPLVLLPRVRESPRALPAALVLATGLGLLAVAVLAAVPAGALGSAFGPEYVEIAGLVAPYVAAMALLGVGRVLVAERVASGRGRPVVALLLATAAAQVALVLLIGDDPRSIALITLGAMVVLVAGSAAAGLAPATATPERTRRRPPAEPARRSRPARERVPWAALGAITVVALAVRLVITRGVWLDEATSITQAQLPLADLLETLRTTDVHPPLHHLVLWALAQVAGTGELVMRAPSLLAGTLLVPALYALGHLLWDRRAGLVAAALASVAPFLVWYSQEARMYAFFMLFAVVALIGQAWAVKGGGVRAWALYAVASALLLWTQYFAVAFIAVQQLAFLVFAVSRTRADRRSGLRFAGAWIAATLVVVAAVVPLAGFAIDQFQANEAAGRGFDQEPTRAGAIGTGLEQPDIYAVLTNLAWATLGYHSDATLGRLTALWPLAILGALFLLGRRPTWRIHLVVACAMGPLLLLLVAAMAKPFLFEIRYFVATAPLLILLIARLATAWTRSTKVVAVTASVLVAGLGVATADQLLNGTNPRRYDFRGALAEVEDRMRPGDVLVYEPQYLDDVVRYYQPDLRSAPLSDGLPERRWAPRVFFLSSFTERPAQARNTRRALRELSRERDAIGRFSRPQVEVTVFR